ncbi:polynucleotide 5'-hydroxyl-kinase NOL9-like isoform X2 [Musa acuminata AAA Group]|uniref:polynucleotide 5'-hydroxyl-kinase NOL9-like isoform X2 n=1 Tax=Musa acuminata AAA Group TaxID=214697 RepID=UPI0031D8C71B
MDGSSAKRSSSSYTGWTIPEIWEEAADSITNDSSSCLPPITLVCGPGNSGKSTFSRLLLNTLLHRFFFFGHVTAQRDPKVYLNFILNLYDYFHNQHYKSGGLDEPGNLILPLVINTSGWVKGIGYDLLVDMLRYMSPTHVVQMRVSVESKNLPTGFFWLEENEKTSVNLIEIPTVYEPSTRLVLIKNDACIIRNLRLVAYFRQCLPRELDISTYKELADCLASITPYEVPLSRIKVKHLHQQVPSSEVNHSLNATIVGLAVSSCVPPSSEHCTPWCVGLGIIRAIDISKDRLYVITPVSPCELENVDILLRGCLETPACLLQQKVERLVISTSNG